MSKLNSTGAGLVYSTFLGGVHNDSGLGIAIDSKRYAFAAGTTQSRDFPVKKGAFQTAMNGITNTCVVKLGTQGTGIDYATYLGGSMRDFGIFVAADSAGNAYVAGNTVSGNFPTVRPIQASLPEGNFDWGKYDSGAFIAKIDGSVDTPKGPKVQSVPVTAKKLFVYGGDFEAGSMILIDGQEQSTSNDELTPSTTLITNGGKKVKPGRTVRIRVRNSDGTMSNEYSFTRPVG